MQMVHDPALPESIFYYLQLQIASLYNGHYYYYCTVLAVLVEDNRLSHSIVHTFFIPDFNGRYYNRSVTTQELSN
jgi:hypothetical protein